MRPVLYSHVGLLAFAAFLIGPMILANAQQANYYVASTKCDISTRAGFDFQATVAAELSGWFSFGFSSDGGMIGSDAVVGFPTQGDVVEYDLDSKISSFNQPSPLQEITEAAIEKADGVTSLAFTRPVTPTGEGKMSLMTGADTSTILIWAFGPEETFGYHFQSGRGALSFDVLCSNITPNSPTGLPITFAPTLTPEVEVFTSSPTATISNSSENALTSNANGAASLESFGHIGFSKIRAEGVVCAALVGSATLMLVVAGLR